MMIKVPGKAKSKLSAFVEELGGEVLSVSTDKGILKKEKVLSEIKAGLKEVKEIQKGKSASYKMSDLLNGK
ncbi:hypothetical protein ACFQZX_03180 [Mucilaginibacter litoreus]|uniref:Uncharacterized protein n=1 Tax=Mucilaginibacter litoreus TaxID=1048221 RepID=A0ABW3ANK8_9SPHI